MDVLALAMELPALGVVATRNIGPTAGLRPCMGGVLEAGRTAAVIVGSITAEI